MADLSKLYKELITSLEKNIKDKQELDKIKNIISEMMISYTDSINNLSNIQEKQEKLDKKVKKIQRKIERIEDDIYIENDDEDEDDYNDQILDSDYEFEIRCPYCDKDFIINENSQNLSEVECPNCHNIIELDWNDCEECGGNCNHCDSKCYEEEIEQPQEKVAEEETTYKVDEGKKQDNNSKKEENKDKKDNKKNDNKSDNKNTDDDM